MPEQLLQDILSAEMERLQYTVLSRPRLRCLDLVSTHALNSPSQTFLYWWRMARPHEANKRKCIYIYVCTYMHMCVDTYMYMFVYAYKNSLYTL